MAVVIAAYEDQPSLMCAIRSLARQRTAVAHVVVVDDGSQAPLNLGLASQWFSSSTKLELIRQDPNEGPASARNLGVSATTCTYISFLDHDDIAHPSKIERQLRCLRAGADVVVPLASSFSHLSANLMPVTFGEPYAMPIGLMMRRSLFEQLGGMKDILGGDDMELIMNARMSGLQIEFMDEVLLYRRVGESNLSLKIHRRRTMLRAASAALKHSVAT